VAVTATEVGDGPAGAKRKPLAGRRKILLLGLPVAIAGAAGGLWSAGILQRLWHSGGKSAAASGTGDAARPAPPVFAELPEIIANLDAGPRRIGYVKLKARLELEKPADVQAVQAVTPRLLDLFPDLFAGDATGRAARFRRHLSAA
jgi:flagellar FliL protein